MLGNIIGDIIGSIYESNNIRTKDFVLFGEGVGYTDDSILTLATAKSILYGGNVSDYFVQFAKKYKCPKGGYGTNFSAWLYQAVRNGIKLPYNSCGNGSAMRVGPIGWAYNDEDDVLSKAKENAECTHNHPEGIKGAQAVALSIFLAKTGNDKNVIEKSIHEKFHYDFDFSLEDLQKEYGWHSSKWAYGGLCQGSVPQAIKAFLEGTDFEDCIRNAISIGGDSDTIACITGGIAEAYFGIPFHIYSKAMSFLEEDLTLIVQEFENKFGNKIINDKV